MDMNEGKRRLGKIVEDLTQDCPVGGASSVTISPSKESKFQIRVVKRRDNPIILPNGGGPFTVEVAYFYLKERKLTVLNEDDAIRMIADYESLFKSAVYEVIY